MKLYAVLLFLVAYQVTEGFKFKRCEDSEICGDNRCCVRSTPTMPWVPEITKCKSMAKLGQECNPDPDNNGVYQFNCPCGEGMECVDVSESSSDSLSTSSPDSDSSSQSSTDSDSSSSDSSSSSSSEEDYRCVAVSTSNENDSTGGGSNEPEE